MKDTLTKYKPIILFLLKYFSVYGILLFSYNSYLNYCKKIQSIDFFTCNTSFHSLKILTWIDSNYQKMLIDHSYFNLLYQGREIARIVEGCNGISIIILFFAFVFAFSKNIKKTLEFALLGSVTIYVFNILRIIVIVFFIQKYPEYQHFLHQIVFPLLLYGYVFALWIYWIKKFLKND